MTTDTSEKGLETLIMRHMTGEDGLCASGTQEAAETPDFMAEQKAAGSGWHAGFASAYDRAHCIDAVQLFTFLFATQPETLAKLNIGNYRDAKNITRQKFLARISSENEGLVRVSPEKFHLLEHPTLHYFEGSDVLLLPTDTFL